MHRLSDINPSSRTAVCAVCGPTRIKPRTNGAGRPGWRCRTRENERRPMPDLSAYDPNRYRIHKGTCCALCGFGCALCGFEGHPCQLDVDHKDGNHRNNSPENLWTLCANCHRLKTHREQSG